MYSQYGQAPMRYGQAPMQYGQSPTPYTAIITTAVVIVFLIIIMVKIKPEFLKPVLPPGSLKVLKYPNPDVQEAVDELQRVVYNAVEFGHDNGCDVLLQLIDELRDDIKKNVITPDKTLHTCSTLNAEMASNLQLLKHFSKGSNSEHAQHAFNIVDAWFKLTLASNNNFCTGDKMDMEGIAEFLDLIHQTWCDDPEMIDYIFTDIMFYTTRHLQ